jgi:hypothetical protein
VIDELAQRVPERSLPVTVTSTAASGPAMLMTLSTIALTCSRVYMNRSLGIGPNGVKQTDDRRLRRPPATCTECHNELRQKHCSLLTDCALATAQWRVGPTGRPPENAII